LHVVFVDGSRFTIEGHFSRNTVYS